VSNDPIGVSPPDHPDAKPSARRTGTARRLRSGLVTVTRVNPNILMRAADGDARRILVVDATTVIVHNGPAARH
jgi:hypothetical protein